MKTKSEAGDKLNHIIQTEDIMDTLVTNGVKKELYGTWGEVWKKYLIYHRHTEPYSPWQNRAEREIKEVKNHFCHLMDQYQVPEKLWDFGLEYVSQIHTHTASPTLDDCTPFKIMKGDKPDISELLDYHFYQWVKYYDLTSFLETREHLGHWLGPTHDVRQALCYWILKVNGQIMASSTIHVLSDEKTQDSPSGNSMKYI